MFLSYHNANKHRKTNIAVMLQVILHVVGVVSNRVLNKTTTQQTPHNKNMQCHISQSGVAA